MRLAYGDKLCEGSNHLFSQVLMMIDTLYDHIMYNEILVLKSTPYNERYMYGTLLLKDIVINLCQRQGF